MLAAMLRPRVRLCTVIDPEDKEDEVPVSEETIEKVIDAIVEKTLTIDVANIKAAILPQGDGSVTIIYREKDGMNKRLYII